MATQRYCFMDALNVLACIAVIMLHCSLNIFEMVGNLHWVVALVTQCLFIFAVPVFFMISGANLLGYRERYSTAEFFKKRVKRVILTLIAWSFVVYCYCWVTGVYRNGYEMEFSLLTFGKELLQGRVLNIYWFFYAIIGLYLVTPVFSIVVQNKKATEYALVIGMVFSFIVPTLQNYVNVESVTGMLEFEFFTAWLVYYLLGYYLVHHFTGHISSGVLIAVFVGCAIAMFGVTYAINIGNTYEACGVASTYNNLYAAAAGIFTIVSAPALFLFFKNNEERIAKLKAYPTIKKLSALSLDVYACHMFVICELAVYIPASILWSSVARPVVVYALSLGIAWVVSQGKTLVKRAWSKRKTQSAQGAQ